MPLRDLWGLVFSELRTKASADIAFLYFQFFLSVPITSIQVHVGGGITVLELQVLSKASNPALSIPNAKSADYISRDAYPYEQHILIAKSTSLLNNTRKHAWRSPSSDSVRLIWYEISNLRISSHICPCNPVYLAPIMWQSKYISMTISFLKLFEVWVGNCNSDLNVNSKCFFLMILFIISSANNHHAAVRC